MALVFFFFKQKTAYEMRISDWSSDVCSSDLWDNIIGIDKSGIPTDIGSTGHASDFCFNTMHDQMTIFTTRYSIDFFDKRGRYSRIGGIEVARKGDDERMRELERRVSSGRAFGNRVEMITPQRSEEHTSELQSLMRNSYAVFCLKKKTT